MLVTVHVFHTVFLFVLVRSDRAFWRLSNALLPAASGVVARLFPADHDTETRESCRRKIRRRPAASTAMPARLAITPITPASGPYAPPVIQSGPRSAIAISDACSLSPLTGIPSTAPFRGYHCFFFQKESRWPRPRRKPPGSPAPHS